MAHAQTTTPKWALILGASSGFGEGAARALAKAGYDIAGVHLDRKAGLDHVAEIRRDIEALGRKTQYFNVNAADEEKRSEVLAELAKQKLNVAVLLHSLAFGTLKPYIGDEALNKANIDMTLDVMAHSLVYWAQGVVKHGLTGPGGRIFAMTSSGSTRVFATYGAVSAAKAALESHCRQLALELAPRGIAVNALRRHRYACAAQNPREREADRDRHPAKPASPAHHARRPGRCDRRPLSPRRRLDYRQRHQRGRRRGDLGLNGEG